MFVYSSRVVCVMYLIYNCNYMEFEGRGIMFRFSHNEEIIIAIIGFVVTSILYIKCKIGEKALERLLLKLEEILKQIEVFRESELNLKKRTLDTLLELDKKSQN